MCGVFFVLPFGPTCPSTALRCTALHCASSLGPCPLQCEWAEAQRSLAAERSHSRDLIAAGERAATAAEQRQAQAQAREGELQAALAAAVARADALQVRRNGVEAGEK